VHLVRDALPRPDRRADLIAGVGNDWRGDDAAGLVAARRLRGLLPGVRVVEVAGDPGALLDLWAEAELAIVLDAVRSGAPPGTIHRLDASALPAGLRSASTHALGLADAVELARALDRLPARLELYGIEGAHFEPGEGLTPTVARAVETLCEQLSRAVRGASDSPVGPGRASVASTVSRTPFRA
jgi:hydrogenase maturation protease